MHGNGGGVGAGLAGQTGPVMLGNWLWLARLAGLKHDTAPASGMQPPATSAAKCRWHEPLPPVLLAKKTLAVHRARYEWWVPGLPLHKQQHISLDGLENTLVWSGAHVLL